MRLDDDQVRDRVARIEEVLAELESISDSAARTTASEAVRTLVEVYGEALARVVDRAAGLEADDLMADFADDELLSHLLLLHGLHPETLETRVARALDEVRPYLRSHGGDVELVALEDDAVHLRLQGSCRGCPASTVTLRLAVEEAIRRTAPEVERIEAEGTEAPAAEARRG